MAQVYSLGPFISDLVHYTAQCVGRDRGSSGVSGGHLGCPWYINIGRPGLF